ncbi:MAG: hypothetical protein LC745_12480, partial [Planctomycetia bacterium]|nr:hypothetical protein [Planctomycetia bacterium]
VPRTEARFMEARRSFRPALQQVEDRIVLSSSLNHFFDSIVPKFGHHHASHATVHTATARPHPAAEHHAAVPHHHGIHALRHPAKA